LAPVAHGAHGGALEQHRKNHYHNGADQLNLGISGGVKWPAPKDEPGRIVAQGAVIRFDNYGIRLPATHGTTQ
jgi:hypothetical protein